MQIIHANWMNYIFACEQLSRRRWSVSLERFSHFFMAFAFIPFFIVPIVRESIFITVTLLLDRLDSQFQRFFQFFMAFPSLPSSSSLVLPAPQPSSWRPLQDEIAKECLSLTCGQRHSKSTTSIMKILGKAQSKYIDTNTHAKHTHTQARTQTAQTNMHKST